MNQSEYTALIAMISAVKSQISGIETVIASIANVKNSVAKPTPKKTPDFSNEQTLSDDEDLTLEQMMLTAREIEIKRMSQEAENYGKALMQNAIDTQEITPDGR